MMRNISLIILALALMIFSSLAFASSVGGGGTIIYTNTLVPNVIYQNTNAINLNVYGYVEGNYVVWLGNRPTFTTINFIKVANVLVASGSIISAKSDISSFDLLVPPFWYFSVNGFGGFANTFIFQYIGTVNAFTFNGNLIANNVIATGTTGYLGTIGGANTITASTVTATTHTGNLIAPSNIIGAIIGANTAAFSTITATTSTANVVAPSNIVGALLGANNINGAILSAVTLNGNLAIANTNGIVWNGNVPYINPTAFSGSNGVTLNGNTFYFNPSAIDTANGIIRTGNQLQVATSGLVSNTAGIIQCTTCGTSSFTPSTTNSIIVSGSNLYFNPTSLASSNGVTINGNTFYFNPNAIDTANGIIRTGNQLQVATSGLVSNTAGIVQCATCGTSSFNPVSTNGIAISGGNLYFNPNALTGSNGIILDGNQIEANTMGIVTNTLGVIQCASCGSSSANAYAFNTLGFTVIGNKVSLSVNSPKLIFDGSNQLTANIVVPAQSGGTNEDIDLALSILFLSAMAIFWYSGLKATLSILRVLFILFGFLSLYAAFTTMATFTASYTLPASNTNPNYTPANVSSLSSLLYTFAGVTILIGIFYLMIETGIYLYKVWGLLRKHNTTKDAFFLVDKQED